MLLDFLDFDFLDFVFLDFVFLDFLDLLLGESTSEFTVFNVDTVEYGLLLKGSSLTQRPCLIFQIVPEGPFAEIRAGGLYAFGPARR